VFVFIYIPRITRTLFAVLLHDITQRGNRRELVFFKDEQGGVPRLFFYF
jgi:hypothetical protein